MRNKIFISHANPDDNDQARWLGIQLMTHGYEVWCDVFNLRGGDKFWKEIESEIRNNTCKFLYILTNGSNQKEGCLNELSVAEAVEKEADDKRFIIALHFDIELSHENININLKRKIDVDFKTDWRKGLNDLLEIFKENPVVPFKDSPDFEYINHYWQTIYLNNRKKITREESFSSNWFSFISFPEKLYFHSFLGMIPKGFDWNTIKHPTYYYKKYTATFAACYDLTEQLPDTAKYKSEQTLSYDVSKILFENYEDKFISNKTLRNIINHLIKQGFTRTMKKRSLLAYEISKGTSFCFPDDVNDYSKFSFGQLVGKIKDNAWHYAFSGFPDLVNNVFVIRSHILISDGNGSLIPSARTQQSGRRKQGKNWWNRHWKQKLFSAISLLVDEDGLLRIQVGEDAFAVVNGSPLTFNGNTSYIDPDEAKEALDDYPEEEEGTIEETKIEHE
ncbi:MAG TPA: toll/interleukin-1 receptor domain-containing protein [Bacteroidia bacterium]|nr:toll/interleukin-1 receptor domain-containing protein [Bacteroidia bacterium]